MSVQNAVFGGFGGPGPNCTNSHYGQNEVYDPYQNDYLTKAVSTTDPLERFAYALSGMGKRLRADSTLVIDTRNYFDREIDSLFGGHGGHTSCLDTSRAELQRLRGVFQSAREELIGLARDVSGSEEAGARSILQQTFETLLGTVMGAAYIAPHAADSDSSPDVPYTEFDPWATTPTDRLDSNPPKLAPLINIASPPSQHAASEVNPSIYSPPGQQDFMPSQLSSPSPLKKDSEVGTASKQQSTWISHKTRADSSSISATRPSLKVVEKLSWLSNDGSTFADEDESIAPAGSTDFEMDSDVDSFSPRKHNRIFSSPFSSAYGTFDGASSSTKVSSLSNREPGKTTRNGYCDSYSKKVSYGSFTEEMDSIRQQHDSRSRDDGPSM